jgi:hypothetical protein
MSFGRWSNNQVSFLQVELDAMIWHWPPKDPQPWEPPGNGHIEHYRGARPDKPTPSGWCPHFQLSTIVYLEDVQPAGGGTFAWPGVDQATNRACLTTKRLATADGCAYERAP